MPEKYCFEPTGIIPGCIPPAKITAVVRQHRAIRRIVLISPVIAVIIPEVVLRRVASVPVLVDVASARA
jgi:hypothetical protein